MSDMNTPNNVGEQWSFCKTCKNNDTEQCFDCTTFCDYKQPMTCGFPSGAPVSLYFHHNYEPKEDTP